MRSRRTRSALNGGGSRRTPVGGQRIVVGGIPISVPIALRGGFAV